MEYHNIPPLFDGRSEILVLGSFPSVRSRAEGFYYAHAQNRFWRTLAGVFREPVPADVTEKKAFLLQHGIALWDVLERCEITGSSDASIKSAVPNDIPSLLSKSKIKRVYTNGKTAFTLYEKLVFPLTSIHSVLLPSTSPANAAVSPEELIEKWKAIKIKS